MKKFAFITLFIAIALTATSQIKVLPNQSTLNIIPKPVVSQLGNPKNNFTINANTQIYVQHDSLINAALFEDYF